MASLNTSRRNRTVPTNAVTHQGGLGVTFDANTELHRLALNCYLFENTYYQSGEDIANRMVQIVSSPSVTIAEVLKVRDECIASGLRHTPLWLFTALIVARKVQDESYTLSWHDVMPMLTRPDQATELLAMYWATAGKDKPVPAMYKKAFRKYMPTLDRYKLAKYKQVGKEVQLRDIVRISRPKPTNELQAKDFSDLIKDTLPNEDTWESRLSVPGVDKKQVWLSLLNEGLLGDMAILRNLRNMQLVDVPPIEISKAIRSIRGRYTTAGQIVQANKIMPNFGAELDELFAKLFDTKTKHQAEITIMVDISGSMNAPISANGTLMRDEVASGLAAQIASGFARVNVYSFNTDVYSVGGRNMALVNNILINRGGGTDCYKAWAYCKDKHPDSHLIMVTDEQDGGFSRILKEKDFAPKQKSFLINVAPYSVGLALPENNIEKINGWSDRVAEYIFKSINN